MKILTIISKCFGKYMAVIVLATALLAFLLPASSLWIDLSWINYLLIMVMFGMGLTIVPKDFLLLFTRPLDIVLGCAAQFVIMPALAFGLSLAFNLDPALTAGVILVGTCPGGTASNLITYLAKGDVALSVAMTSVNTLLAPFLTPIITYFLLKTTVTVDMFAMFIGIVKVILIPVGAGFIINTFFRSFTQKMLAVLPLISTVSICMIVASVVSHNAEKIMTGGTVVLTVVILHNLSGYLCGFGIGKIFKMNPEKIKAFSIEVGMQNSGLATALASTAFPGLAMATVPGALFSVWHNISGAILAGIYRKWKEKE